MNWLKTESPLRTKYYDDISKDDGIKKALIEDNFNDNNTLGESISGKRKIISWMLRSWAQEFDMYL